MCNEIINSAINLWGNDAPTGIYSNLGKGVVEKFHNFDVNDIFEIFNIIEVGLNSKNEELSNLIATGFLEGLYIAATEKYFNWEMVKENLGANSYEYLNMWSGKNYHELKYKQQNNDVNSKVVLNKKFIECIDSNNKIIWISEVLNISNFIENEKLPKLANKNALMDGEFKFLNGVAEKSFIVVFQAFGGIDWNIWYDQSSGKIKKITESR